jgi:O-succinylbenzoate synthase
MTHGYVYKYTLASHIGPRQGLLVELITEDGKRGIGEIAPLPGWSSETLSDALKELRTKKEFHTLSPSVAFGLEAAFHSLQTPPPALRVPIAPLVRNLQDAEQFLGKGISSIKIKLGDLSEHEAFEFVNTLKGKFRLRVDLNRKWPLKRSLDFFARFSPEDFDYIEDPCQTVSDLFAFPFPLAVDEFLRTENIEELLKIPSLEAFIFKPTFQGGYSMGKKLHKLASEKEIDLIFSGCYESGVGTSQIALLAHALGLTEKPLGIDTYRSLHDDVLEKPLNFSNGFLTLQEPYFSLKTRVCSAPLLVIDLQPLLSSLMNLH